jgi:hypothetical protein
MLMVIRRATRCGVLARRCFHVRWRDSDFSKQGTLARRDLRIAPRFYFGGTGGVFDLGVAGTAVLCRYSRNEIFPRYEVG